MSRLIEKSIVLFLVILISGCASGVGKLEVKSLSQVGKDEVIVVGKIKLDPVLNDVEQELEPHLGFPFDLFDTNEITHKNKIHISVNKKRFDITRENALWEKHMTTVDLEKTFFIRVKKSSFLVYSGGIIKVLPKESISNKMLFPGGLEYKVEPNDKAIYIGTIEYYRDYNTVEKTTLTNEYAEAQKEFVKLFGNKIKLKKVKPKRI